MRKLLSITLAFVILLSFSACKQSSSEIIVGTWENTNTEVSKIDEVSELLHYYQVMNLEQQIEMYVAQIEEMEDSMVFAYQEIVSNLQNQLESLTVDSVKNNILSNFNIGKFTFNEDSSIVIKTEIDSVVGTWSLNEEEQTLGIKIQGDNISLKITNISKEEMILVQNSDIDTINFDVIYTFKGL